MNYFAHGRLFLDRPYFLAGTAVPDWLNVVDRKMRARSKGALPLCEAEPPETAEVARGIVQHHKDDDWFHRTKAFGELSWRFTVWIRDQVGADDGLRPSFLGHILVELLLDAELTQRNPVLLSAYYDALAKVEPTKVETAVNAIATRTSDRLAWFIERFLEVRFLEDYADDEKLTLRLNQVLQRVKLPALPGSFAPLIPTMRAEVAQRYDDLLSPEADAS
ncbi:hypothetical protein [Blastopirellula retiformator]|uniref:Acyl carrier protein phosphodiesterase n=1 Tax=Blastopirellula retiformator TaxID=2527970 RepID=A0A5C5V4Y3_9BACT|nr:hypothetical protein [Blastopirellula retiformator]TWT33120.1 hypothetical protein Enr8_29400 [Blastopirellula retiformator]